MSAFRSTFLPASSGFIFGLNASSNWGWGLLRWREGVCKNIFDDRSNEILSSTDVLGAVEPKRVVSAFSYWPTVLVSILVSENLL